MRPATMRQRYYGDRARKFCIFMISAEKIQNLKRADPDRYRASLFANKAERSQLALLYSFHYELAKIPEIVSEPMIGQIRYQWWRDAIAEIYEGRPVRAHEISTPLAAMLRDQDVPRYWIDTLINGRERDIDPVPFADMAAAKDYCKNTSGVLMQIAMQVLGAQDTAIGALAGQVWGLTGLARGWRYYHGSMLQNIDFNAVITAAQQGYTALPRNIDAAVIPALAYTALVPIYLKKMQAGNYNPAEDVPQFSVLRKQTQLVRSVARGHL